MKTMGTLLLTPLLGFWAVAVDAAPHDPNDQHYTPVGFFDVHVCNWPGEPLFLLALFSTTEFDRIESVSVYTPDGGLVGTLDPDRYRLIAPQHGKREKRVFITHFPIGPSLHDGWYSARIRLTDGSERIARDFVFFIEMPRASGLLPASGSEDIESPRSLQWTPVPGAAFYQVFVKDLWAGQTVLESDLMREPRLTLPQGLIKPGGIYRWRVHARDVNGHPMLGDFNDGSLSAEAWFSVRSAP